MVRYLALFLCFILALGETVTRIFGVDLLYEYDQQLGWKPKSNFSSVKSGYDLEGRREDFLVTTNVHGFRMFGNVDNGKKRILFVGDSFTGDPHTSNEEAYFGVVKKKLPIEVFAIGVGGYGTLQELMLVRKFSKTINPDIFVLQYCTNDIVNNSFFLEGLRIVRNQKNLRPYLVNNQVVYRLAPSHPYVFMVKNSRLFRTVDLVMQGVQYKYYGGYAPAPSEDLRAAIEAEMAAATKLTLHLMKEMRASLPPKTKVVTFSCSSKNQAETNAWLSIATEADFDAYESVSMCVEKAERARQVVRGADGAHWNRLGHKIAGEELANIIQEKYM
ncbi:hypothetical protein ACUUL3_13305 [Thiovibrio sp. JS02]